MQPILEINLSDGFTRTIEIPQSWIKEYLGGASLGGRILYRELTPSLDPLGEEAPLLFITGPLSGTAGPAVGRFVVCGKSPATGIWGESNCGGFWGTELRKAGFDGLLIRGKADKPTYLSIVDGQIQFHSAEKLWGLSTYDTQKAILGELGHEKYRVAVIGPAGERLIPFSIILTDHGRVAGRTGMGAVMGAKNLKGIAVRGTKEIPLSSSNEYHKLRSELNRELRNENESLVLRELGTAGIVEYFDYLGLMPKKYYQLSRIDGVEAVSGAYFSQNYLKGVSACHACVIACGRVVQISQHLMQKGPEYESIVGFGPNLLITDAEVVTQLADLCDRLGLDSISASNTIGLAIKLYEQGIITTHDTKGIKLSWANGMLVQELLEKIAKREGFGNLLAQGAKKLAEYYKMPEEAVQVKGLEVPYHDPRGGSGMALVYATSPRGACHNQSDYFFVEIGQTNSALGIELFSRHGGEEKALNVALHQNWRTVFNSLVMCIFANVPPEQIVNLINLACGFDINVLDLMKIGERGWNLKRLININLGVSRKDDTLPKAFAHPYQDGMDELENFVPDFEKMLSAYYQARGWDKDGKPNQKKLDELGLKEKDLLVSL